MKKKDLFFTLLITLLFSFCFFSCTPESLGLKKDNQKKEEDVSVQKTGSLSGFLSIEGVANVLAQDNHFLHSLGSDSSLKMEILDMNDQEVKADCFFSDNNRFECRGIPIGQDLQVIGYVAGMRLKTISRIPEGSKSYYLGKIDIFKTLIAAKVKKMIEGVVGTDTFVSLNEVDPTELAGLFLQTINNLGLDLNGLRAYLDVDLEVILKPEDLSRADENIAAKFDDIITKGNLTDLQTTVRNAEQKITLAWEKRKERNERNKDKLIAGIRETLQRAGFGILKPRQKVIAEFGVVKSADRLEALNHFLDNPRAKDHNPPYFENTEEGSIVRDNYYETPGFIWERNSEEGHYLPSITFAAIEKLAELMLEEARYTAQDIYKIMRDSGFNFSWEYSYFEKISNSEDNQDLNAEEESCGGRCHLQPIDFSPDDLDILGPVSGLDELKKSLYRDAFHVDYWTERGIGERNFFVHEDPRNVFALIQTAFPPEFFEKQPCIKPEDSFDPLQTLAIIYLTAMRSKQYILESDDPGFASFKDLNNDGSKEIPLRLKPAGFSDESYEELEQTWENIMASFAKRAEQAKWQGNMPYLHTISGNVFYPGEEKGKIHIQAEFPEENKRRKVVIAEPGKYLLNCLENKEYKLSAYLDLNENNRPDPGEPWGEIPSPVAAGNNPDNQDVELDQTVSGETGIVRGTIRHQSSVAGLLFVELFDNPEFRGEAEDQLQIPAPSFIPSANESEENGIDIFYRFKDLEPGEYYLQAYLDTNGNGHPDPEEFEPYGFYADAQGESLMIELDQEEVQDIDLFLYGGKKVDPKGEDIAGQITGRISYEGGSRGRVIISIIRGRITNRALYSKVIWLDDDGNGDYEFNQVTPDKYILKAYLDINNNNRQDGDEPQGTFGVGFNNPPIIVNANQETIVNLRLIGVDSGANLSGMISGTISYQGNVLPYGEVNIALFESDPSNPERFGDPGPPLASMVINLNPLVLTAEGFSLSYQIPVKPGRYYLRAFLDHDPLDGLPEPNEPIGFYGQTEDERGLLSRYLDVQNEAVSGIDIPLNLKKIDLSDFTSLCEEQGGTIISAGDNPPQCQFTDQRIIDPYRPAERGQSNISGRVSYKERTPYQTDIQVSLFDSFQRSLGALSLYLEQDSGDDEAYHFYDLAPGVYYLEAFLDLNGDGRHGCGEPIGREKFTIEAGIDQNDLDLDLDDPLPQKPETPQTIFTYPEDQKVILNWEPVCGATGYNIYLGTEAGLDQDNYLTKISEISEFSYAVLELENDQSYYFRLSAENSIGESGLSPAIEETPLSGGIEPSESIPLMPPYDIWFESDNGEIKISFAPLEGIRDYNLYLSDTPGVRKTGGNNTIRYEEISNPFTVTDLSNEKSYYFVLTSVSQDGQESEESWEVEAIPFDDQSF